MVFGLNGVIILNQSAKRHIVTPNGSKRVREETLIKLLSLLHCSDESVVINAVDVNMTCNVLSVQTCHLWWA